MRIEDELGGIPSPRAALEVVQQQATPSAAARLGAQVQVLDLEPATERAVRNTTDAAASDREITVEAERPLDDWLKDLPGLIAAAQK